MKNIFTFILSLLIIMSINSCSDKKPLVVEVYETSAAGNKLDLISEFDKGNESIKIQLKPDEKFQKIQGFGGSFTESTAYLLNELGDENRQKVLQAYFGDNGSRYSLTRTHINSCDFSLNNYSYAEVEGDTNLENFSIDHDKDDIIPAIKEAMEISSEGFKIISSPWTAPPWMKDNKDWKGGKLLPQYYDTWALFFSKYLEAYKNEGIDIWGISVENEPLG
ncbi:MAG: glycosyl hydrolase family 30, partial [Bacteroidia bacterium]|nr:glycosyl hydrolase family 30 [Bacteroidia bacterium]